MENNINLIRSIAWSFHHTTGVNYQDLFSEACLGYYEAVEAFSSDQNCKLTSFAQTIMKRKLINFCKNETKHVVADFSESYDPVQYTATPIHEIIEDWPEECKFIAEMILKKPAWFTAKTPNFKRKTGVPKTTKGRIKHQLRKHGWEEEKITSSMQLISELL